jgi:mono/diheme cytochrome c family protein
MNCKKSYRLKLLFIYFISAWVVSCSPDSTGKTSLAEKRFYDGKGTGPVTQVDTGLIQPALVENGKKLFAEKCATCHFVSNLKNVGPGLAGVTTRRRPEWIMNQILNPVEMTQSDSMAKELLSVYIAQMPPMGINQSEARSILEYFRSVDGEPVN